MRRCLVARKRKESPMNKSIVGVTIDKIQNYLYYTLNSKIQESQNDDGTLQAVVQTSEFVSTDFSQKIKQAFPEEGNPPLLDCSGKYIFTSTQDELTIRDKLNELFQEYYLNTDGQLLIKFVCLPYQEQKNKVDSIKCVNGALKKSQCLNKIIEENQATLFQFPKRDNENTKDQQKRAEKEYPAFAKNINDLASEDEQINQNHFRIAVIKADFDGMGALLGGLQSYEVYKKISDLLSEYVSIDKLHKYTKKVRRKVKFDIESGHANYDESDSIPPFKVYPLYVAGDDIFFAVRIEHVFNGIELCRQLLQKLDKKLSTYPRLSLSIGVELTFNREPLRYYYERVSQQLDNAKKSVVCLEPKMEEDSEINNEEFSTLKVSFNGTIFLEVINEQKQKQKRENIYKANPDMENLYSFTQEIYRMNRAIKAIIKERKDDLAGKRFFYTLLQKLTDENLKRDEQKYKNTLLYHLLPQTWETGTTDEQNAEFELLVPLIERISKKRAHKNIKDLVFETEELKALENYVRLMVLCSDPRFKILVFSHSKDKGQKTLKKKGAAILINRSMRYLYDQSLRTENSNQLRELFIQPDTYDVPKDGNKNATQKIAVYRTLNIGTSTFYRLKKMEQQKIYHKENQKKVAEYNLNAEKIIKAFPKLSEEHGIEKENSAPNDLPIDVNELSKLLASADWNENYIDSLLIFYKLKQLLITFKTKIKK